MKSDDPEILLTFAHYGEAGAFIREKGFQPLDFCDNGLYESSNTLLLLTGEGISSTMERLSAVCREFKHHISEVINLGIAGSLSKKFIAFAALFGNRTAESVLKLILALKRAQRQIASPPGNGCWMMTMPGAWQVSHSWQTVNSGQSPRYAHSFSFRFALIN
jgi:hypothetical protein